MRTRTRVVVAGLGAALSAGLLAPSAAADGGVKTVQVRDECDAASFNEFLQDDEACDAELGGDTTIQELLAALHGEKGARAMEDGRLLGWRNNPVRTSLDAGEKLRATSRGGEFHTFSRVNRLGGGCVDELNEPLGLPLVGEKGNNCATMATNKANPLPAGGTVHVARNQLKRGHNHFQCLIHPWMHTTVHVR